MESSKQFTIIDDSVLEDKTNKPTTSDLTRNGSLQDVRDAVANLFQNFIMTKTHQQSHHGVYYGIYKAAVDSLSGTGQKYIVAIVPNDQNIRMGSEFLLKTLPWISFQSRVTEQPLQEFAGFRLKPQPYQNQISRTNILFDRIKFAEVIPDDEDFDLIISRHVVEHIDQRDWKKYFEGLGKLLKKGGNILIDVPNQLHKHVRVTYGYHRGTSMEHQD